MTMNTDRPEESVSLPIRFRIPDEAFGRYATNIVVQRGEYEYVLTFFEIKQPVMLDPAQPPPSAVNADYICRIIVAEDRLEGFIKALQTAMNANPPRISRPEE
jgi:hypothetical protein